MSVMESLGSEREVALYGPNLFVPEMELFDFGAFFKIPRNLVIVLYHLSHWIVRTSSLELIGFHRMFEGSNMLPLT